MYIIKGHGLYLTPCTEDPETSLLWFLGFRVRKWVSDIDRAEQFDWKYEAEAVVRRYAPCAQAVEAAVVEQP